MTRQAGPLLLSAALIVRNEERHLDGCLRSLDGLVDEIVVVDTGSVDRSREVAAAHGARVVDTAWQDDFARARNLGLDHARGAWILYIDADERVTSGGNVRAQLERADGPAALVRFRVQSGLTRCWEYRLFRNLPSIRFRGAIHETVVPDVKDFLAREGGTVVETALELDHLGYDGDRGWKYARDLPLLKQAVRDDPERIYLWHALGVAHAGLGEIDAAETAWLDGLDRLRRKPGRPATAGLLLFSDLTTLRHKSGQDAAALVAEAGRLYPDHPLTRWLTAKQAVAVHRYRDAIAALEFLVAIDPDRVIDRRIAMDRRMFREAAYELLGTCWLQAGDPGRAADWLRLAEAEAGGASLQIRVKRQMADARLARSGGAAEPADRRPSH